MIRNAIRLVSARIPLAAEANSPGFLPTDTPFTM
jgi:hypothetical protein